MNRKQTGRSQSNSSYPQRDQYRNQKANADYSNYNANSSFSDYEDDYEFAPQNQNYRESDSYENPRRSSYRNVEEANNYRHEQANKQRTRMSQNDREEMRHAQNDFGDSYGSFGATPKNQYGRSTYGNTTYGNPSSSQFTNGLSSGSTNGYGSSYNDEEFLGKNTARSNREWSASDRYNTNDHFSTSGSSWGNQGYGSQQTHFGKGPKGYKRSDARIEEEVCEALARNHEVDASDIEVSVSEGCVTLSGTTDSKYAKRAAEMAIENLSGVDDVKNEIKVKKSDDMSSNYSSSYDSQSSTNSKNSKANGKTSTNSTNHIS